MTDRRKSKIDFGRILRDNAVMILFVALSVLCVILSGMRLSALFYELMGRITRNAFIILALIIPIVAGMGINFAITIGAMAAQIAILLTLNWEISGISGFLVASLLTVPLAALFGLLIGMLLNKMKGQEMIGSMILGFFANGLYQLLFLYIFGTVIPIQNKDLTIVGATGIKNTMDLSVAYGFKNALDNLTIGGVSLKLKFAPAVYWAAGILVAVYLVMFLLKKKSVKSLIIAVVGAGACVALMQVPVIVQQFSMTQVPMATFALIALLCVFNVVILRTRLGQRFRAVGQNRAVANAAGINVNRTRITAIMMSTVLAGLGQVIFMQSFGTVQTYSAHEQVGLYAGAAILVGGASIVRATNKQAILGCILFHMLFIVAPKAGNAVFGKADIGEHFRVFVSYGVIALALVLHGLRGRKSAPERAMREAGAKG